MLQVCQTQRLDGRSQLLGKKNGEPTVAMEPSNSHEGPAKLRLKLFEGLLEVEGSMASDHLC